MRLVKRIGMVMSGLMVLTLLVILGLIVRTERAHDEANCGFRSHSERSLGATRVVEEMRRCLPELEERRYLIERAGRPTFELARKRMPPAHFTPERYKWSLREDETQKLVIAITVDGHPSSEFFEADAQP